MRSDAWEQTYAEFVAAREPELRRLARATHPDPVRADDALRRGLTALYLAWPRLRRDGTEEAEARRLVAGTGPDDATQAVIGLEAPARPVEEYVAAGRTARRRRRLAVVLAGLTGMLTAVGVTLAVLPRSGGGIGPDPLPLRPTVLPTPIPVTLLVPPRRFIRPDTPPLFYLYGRMYKRSNDVTVLTTFGTPEPAAHPRGGGIVQVGGTTIWVVAVGSEPEALVEQQVGPYDPDAFQIWQASEQAVLSGRLALAVTAPGGYRPPVSDDASPAAYSGGRLVAKPGGEVTQRVLHPVASRAAVQPCHDQAVRVHTAAEDWFVLGYDCADGGALYSEPVGVRADTLASWLTQVRRVQDRFMS